jgi:hypothetical protein
MISGSGRPRFRHQGCDKETRAKPDGGKAEERRVAPEVIGNHAGCRGAQRCAAADREPDHPESGRVAAPITRKVGHDQWRQDPKGCRAQSIEQLDQHHQIRVASAGEQHASDRYRGKAKDQERTAAPTFGRSADPG